MIKLDRKKRKPKKDDDEEEKERTEVDFTSDALVGTVEVRVKKFRIYLTHWCQRVQKCTFLVFCSVFGVSF